ncbi:MAG: AsmA family protein [Planctomycetes bacterium]|nr:AsmA family protein [Planctomycetota bacterium]
MKKKIINGVLITIIVCIVLSIVGIFVLDGVAQSVIQSKGSEGLGVSVRMNNVHVGFFGKNSGLKGLTIANPEPFNSDKTPNILSVDNAEVEFSILQLFDKEVIIPTVLVEGVVLHLQQDSGKSNIETLVNTISEDESPQGSHPEPPFNIKTFTIRDITVIANGKFTVLDSGDVTAHIKEIVINDVGTDGDAEIVTEAITTAVTQAIMKHIAENPVQGFSKIAFSQVTGLINELPVFKQLGIGNAIQGVTDTAGKAVDGILGGIGDLLGGDKKEK